MGCDYSAVYQQNKDTIPSRRWEASRDGVEDYRLLHALAGAIEKARKRGQIDAANKAQKILDNAVENTVQWLAENVDEITRMVRAYDLNHAELIQRRTELIRTLAELVPQSE
jgi:hypothetical protein